MMYRIEYLATFHSDIAQVAAGLEEYPLMAARIFAKMDKILGTLVFMPEMFPIYDNFPIFRKIVIEDYLLFYTFNKTKGLIEIHRLLYSRMDIPRHLTNF